MKQEHAASEGPTQQQAAKRAVATEAFVSAVGRRDGPAAAVAATVGVTARQAAAAIRLLRDEQASLPFVARYRKEATQGLDEAQLRGIERELGRLEALETARASVLAKLQKAGVLSGGKAGEALRAAVAAACSVQELEDLYLPHRPKRSTRASAARDKGLAPLADAILAGARGACSLQQPLTTLALHYVRPSGVPSVEAALAGARDILAERAAELPDARAALRAALRQRGTLVCKLSRGARGGQEAEEPDGGRRTPKHGGKGGGRAADADTYRLYHAFTAPLRSLRPHQVLAIGRGEAQGVLSVGLEWDPLALAALCRRTLLAASASDSGQQQQQQPCANCVAELAAAVADGLKRLLRPAAEREARSTLAEAAGEAAAAAFARNLRGLLLQPPLPGAAVLGVDPAFRTGCKLAVVDATGRLLETAAVHPHPPALPAAQAAARTQLLALIDRHDVRAVAVGNGVASRETQRFVAEALAPGGGGGEQGRRPQRHVGWCVVSEAGASVYRFGRWGPALISACWLLLDSSHRHCYVRQRRKWLRRLSSPPPPSPAIAYPSWLPRSCLGWTCHCGAPSLSRGGCRTRWQSWSKWSRRAWGCAQGRAWGRAQGRAWGCAQGWACAATALHVWRRPPYCRLLGAARVASIAPPARTPPPPLSLPCTAAGGVVPARCSPCHAGC